MSQLMKGWRRPAKPIGTRSRVGLLRGIAMLVAASCLVGPSQADGTLDWIVSAITEQEPAFEQVSMAGALSRGSTVQSSEHIATGDGECIVLTRGQDVLELQPNTSVTIGDTGPHGVDTVVKLLDGTVHVKVGKRAPGRTFAVQTRFLVATVKGTEFEVAVGDAAAAVSVSEGTVAVQSAGGHRAVDVTAGRTAVAAVDDSDSMPDVGATPAGGARQAAKAKSGKDAAGAAANGTSSGKGSGNGGANGSGNGGGNGHGGGNGNGGANGSGNGHGGGNSRSRIPALILER
jgi:hypothetical protein